MLKSQDPKYGIRNGKLFNRHTLEDIPEQEPVFILRASDQHTAETLNHYAEKLENIPYKKVVEGRVEAFYEFRKNYPECRSPEGKGDLQETLTQTGKYFVVLGGIGYDVQIAEGKVIFVNKDFSYTEMVFTRNPDNCGTVPSPGIWYLKSSRSTSSSGIPSYHVKQAGEWCVSMFGQCFEPYKGGLHPELEVTPILIGQDDLYRALTKARQKLKTLGASEGHTELADLLLDIQASVGDRHNPASIEAVREVRGKIFKVG